MEDELPFKVTMRYTYESSRYLVLIEQKVAARRYTTQWGRGVSVRQRVEKLEALLVAKHLREKVADILSTIPDNFVAMFPRLKLVA